MFRGSPLYITFGMESAMSNLRKTTWVDLFKFFFEMLLISIVYMFASMDTYENKVNEAWDKRFLDEKRNV